MSRLSLATRRRLKRSIALLLLAECVHLSIRFRSLHGAAAGGGAPGAGGFDGEAVPAAAQQRQQQPPMSRAARAATEAAAAAEIKAPERPPPFKEEQEEKEKEENGPECLQPPWKRNLTEHPVLVVGQTHSGWPDRPEQRSRCPIPCLHTRDQKLASKADVLLYELLLYSYPDGNSRKFPERSCPHQQFALLAMESHANYPFLQNAKSAGYDILMDYRLSSDVPAPYYGVCDLLRPASAAVKKSGEALASAFISNCSARNNRKEVLEELMTYISVHSYGSCLHNKDTPPDVQHLTMWNQKTALLKRYKFAIAFENSDSED